MKYFVVLALIINTSCSWQKPASNVIEDKESEKVISVEDSLVNTTEVIETIIVNDMVFVINDTIRIKTEKGNVDFVSRPNLEEDISNFYYKEFNETNLFHVVCAHYWEDNECYLIDQKTSRIDTLWTKPIFSLDNNSLISKSMDYGLEGMPNGFQIWQLDEKRHWIKTKEIDQLEWVPIEINWINNDSFEVKTVTIEHYNEMKWNVPDLKVFKTLMYTIDKEF